MGSQGGKIRRLLTDSGIHREASPLTDTGRRRSLRYGRSSDQAALHGSTERGAITAEVAVVLPALVALLALLLGTAHVGVSQLRLDEAARAGAREAMRGESTASIEATVERLAGREASLRVGGDAGWRTVEVSTTVSGPFPFDIDLTATASGRVEHHD